MKYSLILFTFLCSLSFYGQDEHILKITFRSSGMTPVIHFIIVQPDSTFVGVDNRMNNTKSTTATSTSAHTWSKFIKAVSEYKLQDLENLPSPTNYRSGDGANFSSIIIETNKKEYHCGEFDNYSPNKKLEKLMYVLMQIKGNTF